MPSIDILIDYKVSRSTRCQQLDAMFDVPPQERSKLEWKADIPFEKEDWNVGLIVGPSGSGKTTIAKKLFGTEYHPKLEWGEGAVIDNFRNDLSISDIAEVCSSVGFNTVPAWMRPFHVLSNGEQFRADIARRITELPDPIVIDEFTSVVDRQVAKVASWTVGKLARKKNRKIVAVTCHHDVTEWLCPNWVFDVGAMKYAPRGCLQHGYKRPELKAEIRKVSKDYWKIFSKYHYLTAELNPAAQCYCLFIGDRPVSFCGILHLPNSRVKNLKRISRVVTLPDWQGLGLVYHLINTLGAAYKALGFRFRNYPAHPSFIRSNIRSPQWRLARKPKIIQCQGTRINPSKLSRNCAILEYVGAKMDPEIARELTNP